MSQAAQEQVQHIVDNVTSSPATAAGVTAGATAVIANLPVLIQALTAFVLLCQAVAWVYKGYKKIKEHKNKEEH